MRDWRGNDYQVGDLILYGRNHYGAHVFEMAEARVLETGEDAIKVEITRTSKGTLEDSRRYNERQPKRFLTLRRLDNVTKVGDDDPDRPVR